MKLDTAVEVKQVFDQLEGELPETGLEELAEKLNKILDLSIEPSSINESIKLNAISHLARIYAKQEKYFLSLILFDMALDMVKGEPNKVACILGNKGAIYKGLAGHDKTKGFVEKAKEIFQAGIDADPSVFENKINLGSMNVSLGSPHEAIEVLKEFEEKHVDGGTWNLGLAYLEVGDYEKGFNLYKRGLEDGNRHERRYNNNKIPRWNGETEKVIAVYGEQGIGDEILFASSLPDLMKDNKVVIDCHPRLQKLFRESFPEARCYGTRKESAVFWLNYDYPDLSTDMVSVMAHYRKKKEDFSGEPYLKANEKLVEAYKEKLDSLGSKKKVGISWAGGTDKTGKVYRYLPLEFWKPLFDRGDDLEFISLQYTDSATKELDAFLEMSDVPIHHWQHAVDDYDHTAALLMNLDLVVTIPQSVVHLAGALGVPCLQICPIQSMWQCGPYGEDAPFYKSVSNIWQKKDQTWEKIISEAMGDICKKLNITS